MLTRIIFIVSLHSPFTEKHWGVMNMTDIQRRSEEFSCVDPHFWRLCLFLKICLLFILPITGKHCKVS